MARIQNLLIRFNRRCAYCGCSVMANGLGRDKATADHVQPKCRGGSDAVGNLVLACSGCNFAKGDMTGDEFREFMGTFRLPETYVVFLSARAKNHLRPRVRPPVEKSRPLQSYALQAAQCWGIGESSESIP